MKPQVLVIDFGSQYTLLIAKMIRSLGVYCEVLSPTKLPAPSELEKEVKALVLSGSPESVLSINIQESYPTLLPYFQTTQSTVAMLGICFGAQLLAVGHGHLLHTHHRREYGAGEVTIRQRDDLLTDIKSPFQVWNSHSDSIEFTDQEVIELATTNQAPACFKIVNRPYYGVQFHPEVTHTPIGRQLFRNFLNLIAGCDLDQWTPDHYLTNTITEIQKLIPENERVLMACSGGVDSTVAAIILQRALGDRFQGVFVDTGLLRFGEADQVSRTYQQLGLHVQTLQAGDRFFSQLVDISDPEEKRKRIGHLFIKLFQEQAAKDQTIRWLGQGTIYPDIIESQGQIKSHHNVGGLPEKLGLQLVEPLRTLFKDEVRRVGNEALALPPEILERHPFPGPGLAIRILGSVTKEKVAVLQQADHIWLTMLAAHGYLSTIWQAGAVLLNCQSVGVMGDQRTYQSVIGLRAVQSENGMTASVSPLEAGFLSQVANEIVNQVAGVNRVVYDITTKPPGTIEWE